MRVALIAPPFISVPPQRYGGTELFLANLARGLQQLGHEPVVYTNGDSALDCESRWLFPHMEWPIRCDLHGSLKDLVHSSWACHDAMENCDVVHLNNAPGLAFSRLLSKPVAYTLHHPHDISLSEFYRHFPEVHFAAISRAQAARESVPRLRVIHHGLDLDAYRLGEGRREYLCSIGRIAPIKGIHTAIAVARASGIPLKIAGEIQPFYRDYWEQRIRPQVDGGLIEYVGEADLAAKNDLLGGALAFLFPIEWEEPFGLVMLEAMACGAPVLAFPRGAAPEVVCNGVSGWLCRDAGEMATRARAPGIEPAACRAYAARHFSALGMARAYARMFLAMTQGESQRDAADSSESSLQPAA
ncbi:MAG: glycosyltransferase family 4 protein [Terriglobales bacterium]